MLYLSFFLLYMTSFTTTTLRFITIKQEIYCSIKAPIVENRYSTKTFIINIHIFKRGC